MATQAEWKCQMCETLTTNCIHINDPVQQDLCMPCFLVTLGKALNEIVGIRTLIQDNPKTSALFHPKRSTITLVREILIEMEQTTGLKFSDLRKANLQRLPLFKNRKGEPAHSKSDGSDWSLGEWCNAVTGELGEAANIIKKIQRGDMTLDEARQDLADELADVQTYLDLLAFRAGIDLAEATSDKFNRISNRVGCDYIRIPK